MEDLNEVLANTGSILSIPIDFIRAINDNKIVLVPNGGSYGNGYAVVTDASGYIGGANDTAGVAFHLVVGRNIISVDIDNDIVDDALLLSGGSIYQETIPDWSSIEALQQATADLDSIRDNAAKGATALQYYITTFSLSDLVSSRDLLAEEVDKPQLLEAIGEGKLILMPVDRTLPLGGLMPISCYVDDLLYIYFVYDGRLCKVETGRGEKDYDIYADEITILDLNDIDTIRENAALGATAVQPDNIKTINGQSIIGTGDITIVGGGQKEVVSQVSSEITILEPNKIYVQNKIAPTLTIVQISTTNSLIDEYSVHFMTSSTPSSNINLPDNVLWANGEVPTLEANCVYELSIVKTTIRDENYLKAVLTKFA